MPSDDELRRVAEDMRALARSLGKDIRAAVDRAWEDGYGSVRGPTPPGSLGDDDSASSGGSRGRRSAREDLAAARRDLRQAQLAVRQSVRRHRHRHWGDGYWGDGYWGEGYWGDGYSGESHSGDSGAGGDALVGADARGEDQGPGGNGPWPAPGCPPRWDNWGRHRYRPPAGVRPARQRSSRRPSGPPPPAVEAEELVAAPVPIPAAPLRHRHDGSTLLGLLAVVFGLAWLAAGTHLARLPTEAVVAVALMVVGATTVVTARTDWALSRRSWPLLGGAVLALGLLFLSASPGLPVGFRHLEFGSRTVAPLTWGDVPASVHGGFGKTVIDLTGITQPLPGARTLMVDGAAGRLEIYVPATLPVVVDARVSAGMIDIDGTATSGVGRVDHQVLHPNATGPVLTLHIESGFGSAAITTGPPVAQPSSTTGPAAPLPPHLVTPTDPPAPGALVAPAGAR